ncbi:hypothetical protein [Vibrio sp. D431a]|uniref:hypothetical protein n=1 Tax=Vibrio sp. D431a TaxID=2837388 RepID=UPI002555904B|nr:hypothetical protein [Vibrio sp. D431a]MDK9790589.1 hypothetical protein [Vibrio sp. D431a]
MKSVSKKIEKLNIAVKVFDDQIKVENKLLQSSKDQLNTMNALLKDIIETLNNSGIMPSGVVSGGTLSNHNKYRKMLTSNKVVLEQNIFAIELQVKGHSKKLRDLIAKKTAAESLIKKLLIQKERADDKAQQQVAELMHTVKSFNQD